MKNFNVKHTMRTSQRSLANNVINVAFYFEIYKAKISLLPEQESWTKMIKDKFKSVWGNELGLDFLDKYGSADEMFVLIDDENFDLFIDKW